MTIAPETQIVASAFDPLARVYSYAAQDGGRRWTVDIKADELDGLTKAQRRTYVATALMNAMRGPADE